MERFKVGDKVALKSQDGKILKGIIEWIYPSGKWYRVRVYSGIDTIYGYSNNVMLTAVPEEGLKQLVRVS